MMSLKITKQSFFPSLLIFLTALLIVFPATSLGYFAMTYDQGRDLLAASRIAYDHKLTLIGPTTGLGGIFYGPWWYYFLSLITFLSKGNPQIIGNFFAILGTTTTLALFFCLKYLTKNTFVSWTLSLVAALSPLWSLKPTMIWNPSLVPLLVIILITVLNLAFKTQKPLYYFLFGLTLFLIFDTQAAFGLTLVIFFTCSLLLFRKLLNRKTLLTAVGALVILLPRIVFDLKHHFLIFSSTVAYITNPKHYGQTTTPVERLFQRADTFFSIFAQTFANGNRLFAALFLLALTFVAVKNWSRIKDNQVFRYILLQIGTTFIFFVIYNDNLWDYYLVGLPILFIVLASFVLDYMSRRVSPNFLEVTLVLLVMLNFNKSLIRPFNIDWEGDDSVYKNQKLVMDFIASEHPHDYGYFAYSPAIFDYPFDYLFYWYTRRQLIERPKEKQNSFYLIIREVSTKKYLKSGWYGDKTHDKTQVLESRQFPGDLLVEKHQVLE